MLGLNKSGKKSEFFGFGFTYPHSTKDFDITGVSETEGEKFGKKNSSDFFSPIVTFGGKKKAHLKDFVPVGCSN